VLQNPERHLEHLHHVREDLLPILIPELVHLDLITVETRDRTLFEEAEDWQKERPLINEQNGCWAQAILLLLGEVEELVESAADLHDGLAVPEDVASELTDIILFSITALRALGFGPEKAVRGKLERNRKKYPQHELQDGVYEDKMKELKLRWNGNKRTENVVYLSGSRVHTK
jgi:NTP pyrophosphatase (non-canonical NTP hydrolase)